MTRLIAAVLALFAVAACGPDPEAYCAQRCSERLEALGCFGTDVAGDCAASCEGALEPAAADCHWAAYSCEAGRPAFKPAPGCEFATGGAS